MGCAEDPPPFDRLLVAACYEGDLRDMIHAFKYRRCTHLKGYLGSLLYEAVKDELKECDLVTAVPLHWSRVLARGYNQSMLLAREVSRRSGVRLAPGVLRRTRPTKAQVGLNPSERKKNLKGVFSARDVEGLSVCVVDDVVTTASTAYEVGLALRRAGASRVIFSGVARSMA
ncbi:MAG TPA: hypothetical protein PLQ43_02945 [Deltaproteobacteria bacterium]|nr:hypothetical protein [Deltaproteobacteria bacterium]